MLKSICFLFRLEKRLWAGPGVFFPLILGHFDIWLPKNSMIIGWLSIFKSFGGAKTGKFAKYIENEGLNTCQYCFANISATKAPIFMKFESKLHKIVNNNQHHFCKDLSTHACTRSINVRAHVLSRARTFMPRVRACVHGSLRKIFWLLFTILWN